MPELFGIHHFFFHEHWGIIVTVLLLCTMVGRMLIVRWTWRRYRLTFEFHSPIYCGDWALFIITIVGIDMLKTGHLGNEVWFV
ncbi:MAG: hypothetical protein KGI70_01520 [Patescibacteria group bacterium]|nr:hypothetical protein [Patescibacteria group bacterium]